MKIEIKKEEINYQNPFKKYCELSNNGNNISLLMESRSLNLKYGKQSIIVPNPAVKIVGRGESFQIIPLTKNGEKIISLFEKSDFDYAQELNIDETGKNGITGIVKRQKDNNLEEFERRRQKNISYILRTIIKKFECYSSFAAIYGAIAYDFAKNYYNGYKEEGDDFIFFIPTVVYSFDDIKEKAEKLTFCFEGIQMEEVKTVNGFDFKIGNEKIEYDLSEEEYLENVGKIIQDIHNGRVMQCVFSRNMLVPLKKHPIESYKQLREINPSPYSFYYNFGENQILYGASPERHIAIEKDEIEIRPIAGTIKRSKNPIEDANARISLLTDEKELREHTMLVDLARHELHGLAKNVEVSDLFTLEVYPNLYHLVSGVIGNLKEGVDAVDSLLITMPAGTLSGAPKREAMKMIDQYEKSRRGFYGGVVGYLSFNGGCNTGITIRSVHVKDGKSSVRAGGGIVALSTPEGELNEVKLKIENSVKILGDLK